MRTTVTEVKRDLRTTDRKKNVRNESTNGAWDSGRCEVGLELTSASTTRCSKFWGVLHFIAFIQCKVGGDSIYLVGPEVGLHRTPSGLRSGPVGPRSSLRSGSVEPEVGSHHGFPLSSTFSSEWSLNNLELVLTQHSVCFTPWNQKLQLTHALNAEDELQLDHFL